MLVANGCKAVCEGANMPNSLEATKILMDGGVMFVPGKAANAGGVATSALEMSQNSERLSWSFEEVDEKLHGIMKNIYKSISTTAKKYGVKATTLSALTSQASKRLLTLCSLTLFADFITHIHEKVPFRDFFFFSAKKPCKCTASFY